MYRCGGSKKDPHEVTIPGSNRTSSLSSGTPLSPPLSLSRALYLIYIYSDPESRTNFQKSPFLFYFLLFFFSNQKVHVNVIQIFKN